MSSTIMPVVGTIMLTISEDEKSNTVMHAVQSDNLSRVIRAGFYDHEARYTIDPDAKVEFIAKRPAGTYIKKECIVDPEGYYVEVTLDSDILSAPGNVRAGFLIWDSDKEQSIRSQEFTLHVGEKLDKDEDAPITSDIPLAVQVRQNTADIADLKKNGVGGDCPTKEELSNELKSAWSNSIRKEIAFKSASHPYTDALLALLEIGDAPVTPDNPVDPPDSPVTGEPIGMTFEGAKAVITGLASTNITYSGTVAVIGG